MAIGYKAGQSVGVPLTVESVGETTEDTTVSTSTPVTVGSIGGVSSYSYDNLISGLVAIIVFAIVLRCLILFIDFVNALVSSGKKI